MSNQFPAGTGDPHGGQAIFTTGQALESAQAALILLHGRGASAQSILSLAAEISHPALAALAPQAAGYTWYPQRFMVPVMYNEPYLTSALAFVGRTVAQAEAAGIPAERIVITGFSQGACLAAEYVALNPRRWGGLAVLSGGVIGDVLRDYTGSLDDTPVFIGCSDIDPHIPLSRVHETAHVFEQLGADVTTRVYPQMGHMICQDEIDSLRAMIAALVATD